MQNEVNSSPEPENLPAKVLMTLQRRTQIADLVQQEGEVRVNKLAELFQVSEVTIRSDLDYLEKEGQLTRDRGGAIATGNSRQIKSLLGMEQRASLHLEEKRRIARAAAQLVRPGDTIIMDAGTTVVGMVRHLANIPSLTIVTNALNVALEAGAHTSAHVILLGGNLSREASSTMGPLATQTLKDLMVQKVFLGTQAFDFEHGITDTTMEIAQIKRAMIQSAHEVILLGNSSKWGRAGFIKVAPLDAIQTVISDPGLSTEGRTAIEGLGIKLILV